MHAGACTGTLRVQLWCCTQGVKRMLTYTVAVGGSTSTVSGWAAWVQWCAGIVEANTPMYVSAHNLQGYTLQYEPYIGPYYKAPAWVPAHLNTGRGCATGMLPGDCRLHRCGAPLGAHSAQVAPCTNNAGIVSGRALAPIVHNGKVVAPATPNVSFGVPKLPKRALARFMQPGKPWLQGVGKNS